MNHKLIPTDTAKFSAMELELIGEGGFIVCCSDSELRCGGEGSRHAKLILQHSNQ